jgi:hypothetical protein
MIAKVKPFLVFRECVVHMITGVVSVQRAMKASDPDVSL